MLVETMAENENGGAKASLIGGLSLGYGVAKERLLDFINYCIEIELFYEDEGFIFSRRMKKHKDFREKLSVKGKEGAEKRWKNSPPIPPPIGDGNAKERKGKENKGKEIKGKEEPEIKLWFLKFYHSPYEKYRNTFNGQSTTEEYFNQWKSFIDFIYENKYDEVFECKFVTPHDFEKLSSKEDFTKDKWDGVLKSLLSTGIKPEHNLFFRIPQFLGYNKKNTGKEVGELSEHQKMEIKQREKFKNLKPE
jgi:hypothetical protein